MESYLAMGRCSDLKVIVRKFSMLRGYTLQADKQ